MEDQIPFALPLLDHPLHARIGVVHVLGARGLALANYAGVEQGQIDNVQRSGHRLLAKAFCSASAPIPLEGCATLASAAVAKVAGCSVLAVSLSTLPASCSMRARAFSSCWASLPFICC